MKLNLLSSNTKTGYSLNFPTPETCSKACPFNGKGCYAQKGRFVFRNVKEANMRRLRLYKDNPIKFFELLEDDCRKLLASGVNHVRIFGSGDTPDREFLERLECVAEHMPKMKFWMVSFKAIHLKEMPANLVIRSSWGKGPYTSRVWRKPYTPGTMPKGALCPATFDKAESCAECGYRCWDKRVRNVVYKQH